MFENCKLIHSYSRAQAIEDGVLIDVSQAAKEAGIRYPVALTWAVWERCVTVPPGVHCQDEGGRLCDLLYLLRSNTSKWETKRLGSSTGCRQSLLLNAPIGAFYKIVQGVASS
jgi:hypothetical protein